MKSIGIIAAGILLIFATSLESIAQQDSMMVLSLQKVQQLALEQNYQVKNSRKDLEIANKKVWETTAIGLPQISGSASYQQFLKIPVTLIPAEFFGGQPGTYAEMKFGTEYNISGSLTASQLVFDGAYIVGLQAARIYREMATLNIEKTETDVKSLVARSYFAARMFRESHDIAQENFININQTLRETEQTLKAGFVDEIQLEQLRLTATNLKNTIANLHRQTEVMEQLLKFQAGIDISQPIVLSDRLDELMEKLSLEALLAKEFMPDKHINLRLVKTQEQLMLMDYRRQKTSFLPSVAAFITYQESAQRGEFNFFEDWKPWFPSSIVGVSVNVPIFSSGMRASKVSQARLELEKAQNIRRLTEQSLFYEVAVNRSELQNAYEKFVNEKANIELAQKIYKHTQVRFNNGMASSMELTQASDQLLRAQSGYYSAVFNVLEAYEKLESALGVKN